MRARLRNVGYFHAFLCLFVLIHASGATLYSYGIDHGDTNLDYQSWNLGAILLNLDGPIPLLGSDSISSFWINAFGTISYNMTTSSTLEGISNNIILGPFFAASQQGTLGQVLYRQTRNDQDLFDQLTLDISSFTSSQSQELFVPTYALVVTWHQVASLDDSSKVNTFQLVLSTNNRQTFASFNYAPLTWTSAGGYYAQAGVHVTRDNVKSCSAFLEGSGTPQIHYLASTSSIPGSFGKHIIDVTGPLDCTSGFDTPCGTFPDKGRGVFRPQFELTSGNFPDWNFFLLFTCKPGHTITRDVNSQRIMCAYDSDYYDYQWDEEMPTCIEINKTRILITTIEVIKVNDDEQMVNSDDLKEILADAVSRLLETVGVTDVVNAIDNIRNTSAMTTPSTIANDTGLVIDIMTYVPTFTNKALTNDTLAKKLQEELTNNSEVDLVTFFSDPISVIEMTDSCLQGCLCRNLRDPILCRTGVFKPDLQPDACCGICNSVVMRPYASSIKACCDNRRIYDPTKSICCNGYIKRGDVCPT